MITITPNSNVKLYKGIRLDNTYQNALSFASKAAREAYFHENNPHLIGTFTKLSYQRVTSGQCELEIDVGTVYEANYMAFRNSGFSDRWFYAFVTNVEYVNNQTTRIFYEIDVLTTFYFDWSYLPSFVDREHTPTDVAGEHCLPEPVNTGLSFPSLLQKIDLGSNGYAIVCAKVDLPNDEEFARSSYVGNLSAPIRYFIYNSDPNRDKVIGQATYRSFTVLTGLLATPAWANASAEIVSFFYFPFNLLGTPTEGNYGQEARDVLSTDFNYERPTSLHGYTPRNKKLLTYPYNYLVVDSGETTNQYRFEWFRKPTFGFRYIGALVCNPEIYLLPLAYTSSDASGNDTSACWGEKNVISNFPQVPYAVDSYMAWLAQTQSTRKNKVLFGAGGGVGSGAATGAALGTKLYPGVGTAVGAVAGGLIGGITGAIGASAENARAETEQRDMSNKVSGQSTGTNEIAVGEQAFRLYQMAVTPESARAIDDFFDRYGYSIQRIKMPEIRTRPHWNYIKTAGLNMSAQNVPADYISKIKQIHDSGVTYWKSHDEIGNYTLNNQV